MINDDFITSDSIEDDNISNNHKEKTRNKSAYAFKTISEVARILGVPQHVLRFWETKFLQIKPMKRAGGRRYYRPQDVDLLMAIRELLHAEGYTIRGVQKLIREKGVKSILSLNGKVELNNEINKNQKENLNNIIAEEFDGNIKSSHLILIKNQLLDIRAELIKANK